jgi:superfamily II DNA helicase RecQ
LVDFNKLRSQRPQSKPIDPIEIFLRLPKASGIDDLWNSQAEALRTWFERRAERDLIVKLNTGGGKTLVGLLAAQSIINERGPVLYLSPNNLLVDQTLRMASEYGIPSAITVWSGWQPARDGSCRGNNPRRCPYSILVDEEGFHDLDIFRRAGLL